MEQWHYITRMRTGEQGMLVPWTAQKSGKEHFLKHHPSKAPSITKTWRSLTTTLVWRPKSPLTGECAGHCTDDWQFVSLWTSLFLFSWRTATLGRASSWAAGQEYACSENNWKNWANTHKELRIMFPWGFCFKKFKMVTYFPQKTPIFCVCLPKMEIHVWDFFCYAFSMRGSFFIISLHFSKKFI